MRYIISGKNIDITPGLKEASESWNAIFLLIRKYR